MPGMGRVSLEQNTVDRERVLRTFVAIADHGTTTAAGQAVALSQSASSAALQELEAHFGTPLFDRIGRRLALNGHGRALLEPARCCPIPMQRSAASPAVRCRPEPCCRTTIWWSSVSSSEETM